MPVGVYTPNQNNNGELIMLIDDQGMKEAASRDNLISSLVKQGYSVLIADFPGLGSLGPGYLKGDAYVDNTSFNQWFAGILTGKSIVAMRAEDMIRINNFVKSDLPSIKTIHAVSLGALASELLHASFFETDIKKIALINPFLSYAELALVPDYKPSFITSVVAGAINSYDLPDIMAGIRSQEFVSG